jgi:hypothetical protein
MMSGLATAANRWDWERIDIDDVMKLLLFPLSFFLL